MLTFEEICSRLENEDEIELIDMLYLTSEDIVDRFHDKIQERLEILDIYYTIEELDED